MNLSNYEQLFNEGGLVEDGGEEVYGLSSAGEVEALSKALTAGESINNPGASPGEGFPLRIENLDTTLYNATYRTQDAKFWMSLAKERVYNTVSEFNRLESYGSGDAIFMDEGELAEEEDSTYSRQYTVSKYMGVTRRVTHQLHASRTAHGPAVAQETVNGTKYLIRRIERALFQGDEEMVARSFDGIEALMVKAYNSNLAEDGQYQGYEDENVIDLRGQALSEDAITDLSTQIVKEPNYGRPSGLWGPLGPIADISKSLYPRQRVNIPLPDSSGMAGVAVNGMVTPYGNIRFNPDIFIPESVVPVADGVGKAQKRPQAPTVGTVTSPVYSGASTNRWTADFAGAYWYKVVAGSRFGKSVPAAAAAAVTVAAGDAVEIPVTDNGPDTSFYEVFRTEAGGTLDTAKSIMRVKRTASSQVIRDLNRFLPGTNRAYLLTESPDVYKWKQLLPFSKVNLAQIDLNIRWVQVLYGALQLQLPRQVGMYINVGSLPTGAFAS